MSERITLRFEGRSYDPFNPDADWRSLRPYWTPEESAHFSRVTTEGAVLLPDGEEMPLLVAKRVRARLLGTYSHLPGPGELPEGDGAGWLIPGLWRRGHIPMLGGNPKAGKSTFVVDLAASLLTPRRRFLDCFEPAQLSEHEADRGIWLINAENPVGDLHAKLEESGLEGADLTPRYYPPEGPGWLIVDHLETIGGAEMMDIRDPAKFDMWSNRIMDLSCGACDGRDEAPPLVVIVDGLTAILGSKTDGYGEWYAAFRRLMRELDVENALVVAHNGLRGRHLMNGTEAMGQADGLWNYWMDNPDNPASKRYFSVTPRLGGTMVPQTSVALDPESSRLRLNARASPHSSNAEARDVAERPLDSPKVTNGDRVLFKLREAGGEGLMTKTLTGTGKAGTYLREELPRLLSLNLIASRPEGKGTRWFLKEHEPTV